MSPPLQDNQGKKQDPAEETNKDEPKLSVEEHGGACSNPNFHQEQQESICRGVLYVPTGLGTFVQGLNFTFYLIYGTEGEINRLLIKEITQSEESKKPPGTQVAFLGDSPDGDNYTFQIPICDQGYLKLNVEFDGKKFCCRFGEDLVSIDDIKSKSRTCLDGPAIHEMRLHRPNLPATMNFSLLCKNANQLRTATNFTVMITATDEERKKIMDNHSVEKKYAAWFCNADNLQKNPKTTGNALEKHHDKICQSLRNWSSVVSWLVTSTNGGLDNRFLKFCDDGSLTAERKGEILRHLYQVDNIFALFIEALKTSGGNEELLNFLLQLEDQNSSL